MRWMLCKQCSLIKMRIKAAMNNKIVCYLVRSSLSERVLTCRDWTICAPPAHLALKAETSTGKNSNLLIRICNNLHYVCMKSKYMSVWEGSLMVVGKSLVWKKRGKGAPHCDMEALATGKRREQMSNSVLTSTRYETFLLESHSTIPGICGWSFKRQDCCWSQPRVTFSAWWCLRTAPTALHFFSKIF